MPRMQTGLKKSSEINGIYRVARGIQYHLNAEPNTYRGYRGICPLKIMLGVFYENMRLPTPTYTAAAFKEAFGYEVRILIPEPVNAARIQAAWNAQDTGQFRKYNQ